MPKLSNRIDRTKLKSKTLIENEIKKISQIIWIIKEIDIQADTT